MIEDNNLWFCTRYVGPTCLDIRKRYDVSWGTDALSLYVHRYATSSRATAAFGSTVQDIGEGGGDITARLRFKAPWLDNCVRQDCDISHSE